MFVTQTGPIPEVDRLERDLVAKGYKRVSEDLPSAQMEPLQYKRMQSSKLGVESLLWREPVPGGKD
jgi:hypothetical protein